MRAKHGTIKGQRVASRRFAPKAVFTRRSVSRRAALRIIARAERTGETAAWRCVAEGHLPTIGDVLELSPDVEVSEIRWTARRRRLLEAYGLGGELIQRLNTGTTPPNPRTRTSRFGAVMARLSLYEHLSRSYPVEAALFDAAGFRVLPCWSRHSPHWYVGPNRQRRYCARHRHAEYQRTYRLNPR